MSSVIIVAWSKESPQPLVVMTVLCFYNEGPGRLSAFEASESDYAQLESSLISTASLSHLLGVLNSSSLGWWWCTYAKCVHICSVCWLGISEGSDTVLCFLRRWAINLFIY